MPRIVYIFKGGFPWDGRLEKICRSLQTAGYDVLVVARWRANENERETIDGLNIWRIGYKVPPKLSLPFPDNPLWTRGLKSIFNEFSPDIVIVREFFLVSCVQKALNNKKVPVLIDLAEHYPAAIRLWKKYNENPVYRFLSHNVKLPDQWEWRNISLADAIITVCDEQKIRLVRQYNFNPDNIEIIHNTPDLSLFPKVQRKPKHSPKIFEHHGFLTSDKPIAEFLELFVKFASVDKGFEFWIAGEGDCLPELKQIVETNNAKNVKFLGKYNFKELPNILKDVDIGVVPFPPNEFNNHTIHNKVFDFMAFGIPLLVSDAVPLKRIVEEANCGISLQIDETTIKRFFNGIDDYDWETLSQNAWEISRTQYNWAVDESKLLQFLRRFIQ